MKPRSLAACAALSILLSVLTGLAAAAQSPVAPHYDVPIHGHGQFAATPDGNLYYEKEGSGPPVILVAGGPGGSHVSFHPWFSRLAASHTVIYFDSIGRGRSDRLADPSRYTVARDAQDIEALRRALGYERISVIGQSYGGMPALEYALRFPQHVAHLVLSDTLCGAAGFQANIDNCNREAQTRFPQEWSRLTAMRRSGVKTGTDAYEDVYGATTSDLYWFNPDNAALLFQSGDPKDGFNGDIYAAIVGDNPEWKVGGTLRGYDPRPRMRSLHVPTLVCVGRYDRVATPAIAQTLFDSLPSGSARLAVFERSGHRPWVEESDKYFQTVGAFLGTEKTP